MPTPTEEFEATKAPWVQRRIRLAEKLAELDAQLAPLQARADRLRVRIALIDETIEALDASRQAYTAGDSA